MKKIKLLILFCLLLSMFSLGGCASKPSSYFRADMYYIEDPLKVAIIPFSNLSSSREAGKKISTSMVTHILKSACFDVIEMGETLTALKKLKMRADDGLSIENIQKIGRLTKSDVLLMGAVEEYKIDSSTMLGEKIFVPEVSIIVRLVSTKDGSIIWASNHHRRGDDQVTVFGIGRIDSISELTNVIIDNIIKSLVKTIRHKSYSLKTFKNDILFEEQEEDVLAEERKSLDEEKKSILKERESVAKTKKHLDKEKKRLDKAKERIVEEREQIANELKKRKQVENREISDLQKKLENLEKNKESAVSEVSKLKAEIKDMQNKATLEVIKLKVTQTEVLTAEVKVEEPKIMTEQDRAKQDMIEILEESSHIDLKGLESKEQDGKEELSAWQEETEKEEIRQREELRRILKKQYDKEFNKIKKQYEETK